MADIRRDVADVSPNNYVRPGVQDNSLGTAITGAADAGIGIYVDKAKKRLGNEINELSAQFLEQSPANVVGEDSLIDQTGGLTNTIKQLDAAKQAGNMGYQEFQMRVERATREAIGRTPGLAQEFRQIAAYYSGGPAVEFLAKREADMLEASKTAKEKEDEKQYQFKKTTVDRWVEEGLEVPPGLDIDSQYAYVTQEANMARWNATRATNLTTKNYENLASQQKAGQALTLPQREQGFKWAATSTITTIQNTVLKSIGKLQDPNTPPEELIGILTGLKAGVPAAKLALTTAGTDFSMDSGNVAPYLDLIDSLDKQIDYIQNAPKEVMRNSIDMLVMQVQHMQFQDANTVSIAATSKWMPPELLAHFAPKYGALANAAIAHTELVRTGAMGQKDIMSQGGDLAGNLLANGLSPRSTNYGQTLDAYTQINGNVAQAFVDAPSSEFDIQGWSGANGWINQFTQYPQNLKALDPSVKEELALQVTAAASAAKFSIASRMFGRVPSLQGKVVMRVDPKSPALFVPKPGIVLTPQEQQAIRTYSDHFNTPKVLSALSTLLGVDAAGAAEFIQRNGNALKAQMKAKPAPTTPPGRGQSSTGVEVDQSTWDELFGNDDG